MKQMIIYLSIISNYSNLILMAENNLANKNKLCINLGKIQVSDNIHQVTESSISF